MNDEIAALLGEQPVEPKKKVSHVPLTPILDEDESDGKLSRPKLCSLVSKWVKLHGSSLKSSVVKSKDVQLEYPVVLAGSPSLSAEVVVNKDNGRVDSFEYRCPCGRREQFTIS